MVVADKTRCRTLRGHKAEFCVDPASGLPSNIRVWNHEDGVDRLVEDYLYEDIRVNVGLRDEDFDPANEAYGFGKTWFGWPAACN